MARFPRAQWRLQHWLGDFARLVVAQFTVYEVTVHELSAPEMNVNLQWTIVNVFQYLLNLVLFSRSYVIAF